MTERLGGVLSGLSYAVAYAFVAVVLSGPLKHVESLSIFGVSGLLGSVLSPCLWFLKGHIFRSVPVDQHYLIALVVGESTLGTIEWETNHFFL